VLSNVAWDLIERCRASLSSAELNAAFVCLGVGEYVDAMVIALRAVARGGCPPLPDELIARLTQVQETHYVGPDFVEAFARVSQSQAEPPPVH
jgi:hypothetical protein